MFAVSPAVSTASPRWQNLISLLDIRIFLSQPVRRSLPRDAGSDAGGADSDVAVESAMVRHHYGPWDKRYYHVLAHLEAKNLITVAKEGNSYKLKLTDLGKERAKALASKPSFGPLVERMREIKKTFGTKSGSYLKDLIYRLFDEEVGQRRMGQMIR